jgi:hypothetical protein
MKFLRNITVADICGITGLGCLGVGLWLVYPPIALVVVGGLLILAAYRSAR